MFNNKYLLCCLLALITNNLHCGFINIKLLFLPCNYHCPLLIYKMMIMIIIIIIVVVIIISSCKTTDLFLYCMFFFIIITTNA